jgi:hypothetical protein
MPEAHRQYAERTPQRLVRWGERIGPATAGVLQTVLERRAHPQHGFRACLGILRLGWGFGERRLEAAYRRALRIGSCNYRSIKSILRLGLDRQVLPEPTPSEPAIEHDNLRGSGYYH